MKFLPTSSKYRAASLMLSAIAKAALLSAQPVKHTAFNIENMSHEKILNKTRPRIEPSDTPDKISSQELKKESTLVICFWKIIYEGHTQAVQRLTNHDRDKQMLLTSLQATLQMIRYCQWCLYKTQASLINSLVCNTLFENRTATLIRFCQRILKNDFLKVSQISQKNGTILTGM